MALAPVTVLLHGAVTPLTSGAVVSDAAPDVVARERPVDACGRWKVHQHAAGVHRSEHDNGRAHEGLAPTRMHGVRSFPEVVQDPVGLRHKMPKILGFF